VSFLDEVTPVLLTLDEEPNLARTLGRLAWAREIVVVDSGSTDGTLALLAADPRVRVFTRPFDAHAAQWQHAVDETAIATEWVLALDADYVLTEELVAELGRLEPGAGVAGYRAGFVYCVGGRPLRGSLYPPVTVLFRRRGARYEQDGHAQRVRLDGRVEPLAGRILHDDRKPLSHWLRAQDRYMRQEAAKISATPWKDLGWPDRLRAARVLAPFAAAAWCLIGKGLLLDGRAGLAYTLQRVVAEAILSLRLIERDLGVRR
jgi:glycosyltransferase involved in cell wall biosynthesis